MTGGKGDDTYLLDLVVRHVGRGSRQRATIPYRPRSASISTSWRSPTSRTRTLLGTAALSAKGTDADGNFLTGKRRRQYAGGRRRNDTLEGGKGNDA
jgi:hypothetical protein